MPLLRHTKKPAAKALGEASPGQCFWVNNGPVLRDLRDLRDALRAMSNEQFGYHTARGVNDFAKWVAEVLKDEACAKKIAKAKTRLLALEVVGEALAE